MATSGAELVSSLPADAGPVGPDRLIERDRAILRLLAAGFGAPPVWVQLVSAGPPGILRLLVSADVVALGEVDPIRVSMSQLGAQQWADLSSCVLPTAKIDDLVWEQAAKRIAPVTVRPYPADRTDGMVAHDRGCTGQLGGVPPNLLRANLGKTYLNSAILWRPNQARQSCIYGWHTTAPATPRGSPGPKPAATAIGDRVIQPISTIHEDYFTDYSQTVRLVRREAELTTDLGSSVIDLGEVASDPRLCVLVSHEGPIVLRHPGIPCPPVGAGGLVPRSSAAPAAPAACPIPTITPIDRGSSRSETVLALGLGLGLGIGGAYMERSWK